MRLCVYIMCCCDDCSACEDCAQSSVKGIEWFCKNILCCGIACQLLTSCKENIVVPCCYLIQKICEPVGKAGTAICFLLEQCVFCDCLPKSKHDLNTYGAGSIDTAATTSYGFTRSYYDETADREEKKWWEEQQKRKNEDEP